MSAAGYEPLEYAVNVIDGADLENISLELAPRRAMRVRLSSVFGTVPNRVTIAGTGVDGSPIGTTSRGHVTSDGWVELHGFPSAAFNLLISAENFARVEVAVAPGLESEVVLAPGATLFVRVPSLEDDGQSAKVRLVSPTGHRLLWPHYPRGTQDDLLIYQGSGNLDSIPPGPWRVEVEAMDGRIWTGELEAVANQRHKLVLE